MGGSWNLHDVTRVSFLLVSLQHDWVECVKRESNTRVYDDLIVNIIRPGVDRIRFAYIRLTLDKQ